MPGRPVTRREFAVKRCKLRGGHLVNIETEAENHFLSYAFSGNSSHGMYAIILNASKNATFTVQPYSRFNAILSF